MGEGGFGVVYKGYVNNKTVAVKKLVAVSYMFRSKRIKGKLFPGVLYHKF